MSNSTRDRFDATRAGQQAAERGATLTSCPYMVHASDDEAALAACWARGYASHPSRADSVDYTI